MNFFAHEADYWNNKVKNFLHDPPDKALQIPGHERRSNLLLDALGISATLHSEDYRDEDRIAAGMDRVVLPGYSADAKANGAVDFIEFPLLTHPLGADPGLKVELPENLTGGNRAEEVEKIAQAMRRLLEEDLGVKTDGRGISEQAGLKGDETAFAPVRFHYLHFLYKKRLAQKNIGGLGALWPRLPADTRLPDHSIWQHNSLVSALASCHELSPEKRASIMVFSLTPVQDFIARARKLRDFWSGSLILSWLAFEGIKTVMAELGADHVLYPSLHDQPMVEDLLAGLGMAEIIGAEKNSGPDYGVASFPNKFVFVAPKGNEAEIAAKITSAINCAWSDLGKQTLALIFRKMGRRDDFVAELFQRQIENYWETQWASSPLVGKSEREQIAALLPEKSWQRAMDLLGESEKFFALHSDGRGPLYSVSHALAQSCLAAGKLTRANRRPAEAGIKCDMFGDFEIIHYRYATPGDHNPPPSKDPFWVELRRAWEPKTDFKESERLGAVALVKRLAYRVCREEKNHPLRSFFKASSAFPSTTEMALHDWQKSLLQKARGDEKLARLLADMETGRERLDAVLAQSWHQHSEPHSVNREGFDIAELEAADQSRTGRVFRQHPVQDFQKYYAILLMDGDRMGKLVNGETLGATWASVLAPELVGRLKGDFTEKYQKFWRRYFNQPRLVAPSTHAAISAALGDFSLHTVPAIIAAHEGKLIYAGGDDVCAVLPVSTVMAAAQDIASLYNAAFVELDNGRTGRCLAGTWRPESSRLAQHLGRGAEISISAGVMVAHHKKPLRAALNRAHELLEMAKHGGGRNAFALELDKRSGGGRVMLGKWTANSIAFPGMPDALRPATLLEHFLAVGESLAEIEEAGMTSSLAYRLEKFRPGLEAIMEKDPALLPGFIAGQLRRSREKPIPEEKIDELSYRVAALLGRPPAAGSEMPSAMPIEALIVAKFIGLCRRAKSRAGEGN